MPDGGMHNTDASGIYTYIPNGALSIATVLKKAGYPVSFKDYQFNNSGSPLSVAEICSFLESSSDIVCIGCMCNLLPYLIAALKYVKEKHPEKIFILGGPGPTDVYDALLESFPFLDFIVRGEGETTIVELVSSLGDYERLSQIKGVSYRLRGKVFHNPDRELIEDLDEIPTLDFSLTPAKYNYAHFFTSRGCPFNCGYCNNVTFWRRRVRQRSLENVFAEIKGMQNRFDLQVFCAGDDTFFASSESRIREFSKFYRERKLLFPWLAHHRVNVFNEELMKEMQKINLVSVLLGIDSGSNKILQLLHRNYTIQQAITVVNRIANYLKSVRITFIYGFPFETIPDFLNTLEAILRLTAGKIHTDLTLLAPLRHTEIYKNYSGRLTLTEGPAEAAYSFYCKPNEENISVSRISRTYKTIFSLPVESDADASEVKGLIRDYPGVFLSYYNYESNLGLKDKILQEFNLFLENRHKRKERIVNIENNLVYFGKGRVRLLKSDSP